MDKIHTWSNPKIYLDGKEVEGLYTVTAIAFPVAIEPKEIVFNEQFIEKTLRDYFYGFFDEIEFFTGKVEGWPAFGFEGKRGTNKFCYSFDIRKWDAEQKNNMLYHWMESIKGDIVKHDEKIVLEKNQYDNRHVKRTDRG